MIMYEVVKSPKVTSKYGINRNIHSIGVSGFHNGIDIVSKVNDLNLYAIENGKVLFLTENDGTGCKTVVTAHGGLYPHGMVLLVLYAHCEEFYVKQGQVIKKGQVIAKMGKSGKATGVHLHCSMYLLPKYVWCNKNGKYYKWDYKTRDNYEIDPTSVLGLY